mgnify:FL=1
MRMRMCMCVCVCVCVSPPFDGDACMHVHACINACGGGAVVWCNTKKCRPTLQLRECNVEVLCELCWGVQYCVCTSLGWSSIFWTETAFSCGGPIIISVSHHRSPPDFTEHGKGHTTYTCAWRERERVCVCVCVCVSVCLCLCSI